MKKLIIFALSNLIVIRGLTTMRSRGLIHNFWLDLGIIAMLVLIDLIIVRVLRPIVSAQDERFIRRHVLPLMFLVIVFLGSANSILTIIMGAGRLVDFINLIVGLILVPLVGAILRRNWRRSDWEQVLR